jgi:ATP-dependent helicase/nuclease subunit B
MSKELLLQPTDDLVATAAGLLQADGPSFSNCIVVFPGKRPAHYLRRELGKRVGGSFVPPRLFSIDQFVDYLCTDCLGLTKSTLDPLDAAAILYGLHRTGEERIGGKSFDSLDAFIPLGLRMFAELEELQIAGISARRVESTLTVLNKFYRPFYEEVEHRGYTTRSLKYRLAAESDLAPGLAGLSTIVLAGFFALTGSEKVLFSKLAQLDNVLLLFQNGRGVEKHLRELDVLGAESVGPSEPPETGLGRERKIWYYKSPDSHGQAFAVAAKLNELLERGHALDERTVVVLPTSDVLFPVVHHALSLLPENGYNISLGYPLTRTPVYGFFESLFDVVASMKGGKVYAPEYMKFVLHPYTKNVTFGPGADVTRVLFHVIEEQIAQTKSRMFFSLDSLEDDAPLLQQAATRAAGVREGVTGEELQDHLRFIHDRTIRKLLAISNVGDLSRRCTEILTFLDGHSTAKHHPYFRRYAEAMIEALARLDTSLLRESAFAEAPDYFALLRHSIRSVEVPFPGTPFGGLQVLGFLETRNIRFDRVFLLDANDGILPRSGSAANLIPRSLRESLGLPTQRDQDEIAAYYFDLLVRGAQEVHLFYVENDRNIRSRFIERSLWEKQQEERSEDVELLVESVRYGVALANELPRPVPKTDRMLTDLMQFKYSATALDTYLRCPLKFYYAYVLRLEEREEISGEIDRADLGKFVHRVLSVLFAGTVGRILTREMLRPQEVDRVVAELFTETFGTEFHGGSYLMRKQIINQLGRFLLEYQVPALEKETIRIVSLEERVEVTSRGYIFKGFLDRVEERGTQTMIIDYKTGSDDRFLKIRFDRLSLEDRKSWGGSIGSLQLPLYVLLYSARHKTGARSLIPAYLLLGKSRVDTNIEVRLYDGDETKQEKYALLEQVIFRLLEEITDGSTPFTRSEDLKANCPTCAFRTICGTQWVRGRT